MLIIFFTLFLQSSWCISGAEPPPGSGDDGSGISGSEGGNISSIILLVIVGSFFLAGLVLVSFRSQIGACLHGINVDGAGPARRRAPVGLSQEAIEGFPTYLYEDVKVHRAVDDELECAICLNQFQDHELLRLMPECNHIFHPQCIDPWLHSQATCPICRKIIDPSTNTSTTPTRALSTLIDIPEDDHQASSPVHQGEQESTATEIIDESRVVVELDTRNDRFTLEIPEEVRSKIESKLWKFAKASSGGQQYRSKTPESGRIEFNQPCSEFDLVSKSGLNRSLNSSIGFDSIVSPSS